MVKLNNKYFFTVSILTLLALFILTGCKTKNIFGKEEIFFDIPTSGITGTVSFLPVTIDDIEMEIMTVIASDGTIRIAFNRCERCYKSGKGFYLQENNDLICQQCSMLFPIDKIGIEEGGCSPIPIPDKEKIITENLIKISHDVLKTYTRWFSIPEPEQTEQSGK